MSLAAPRSERTVISRAPARTPRTQGAALPASSLAGKLTTPPEKVTAPSTTPTPTCVESTLVIQRSSPITAHVSSAPNPRWSGPGGKGTVGWLMPSAW